jgi:hypothetical protein
VGASPDEAQAIVLEGWAKRGVVSDQNGIMYKIKADGLMGGSRLKSFYFLDKIGEANVAFHIWFLDEKFVHAEMRFKSVFFAIVEEALKERYGPPTREELKKLRTGRALSLRTKSSHGLGRASICVPQSTSRL